MSVKTKNCIAILIILLTFTALLYFIGCAGSQPKEMTPEEKQAYLDSLRQEHQKELQLLWSLGYEHFKQKNWIQGKKYFKKIAEKDTSGIYGKVLYQRLGTCFINQNPSQPDSAEWAYQIGVKRLPNNPYFYQMLRYIYETQSQIDKAIEVSIKLTELEPDSINHWKSLGKFHIQAGDNDQAIEAYERALQLNPNDMEARDMMDKLIEDPEERRNNLQEMVKQKPDDLRLRMDLVQVIFKLAEYEQSLAHLKLVISKEPKNISALEYLGEAYQQIEKYTEAVATYKKILEIEPDDKKNLCNMAMSYTGLGKYTTAMARTRKALSIDPKYGLAYLTRGIIYETASDRCSDKRDGKISFDDKLVYQKAYNEYKKASGDIMWRSDAQKRMSYLAPLLPQNQDFFMHPDQKEPKDPCYEWIQ